ncbi:hypothetical protein BO70DRAFT_398647 [Aspergillus heteromorphus CBS 117.55]|uniref:Uncharacterized protein n=1 Tax=Aspergillus heteromorphus CBS 117.55 TaxID=1448321 RepID=A0A317VMK9_9EURO|nr:uncharacterized protein BO70DRAFT_398647 [Aspergillus heteromorphus CBS 117.55]PWY74317.1 hypothetical protein BO70DRAFT_398647 [Aspergillus heteromorphus CBS 117.55]
MVQTRSASKRPAQWPSASATRPTKPSKLERKRKQSADDAWVDVHPDPQLGISRHAWATTVIGISRLLDRGAAGWLHDQGMIECKAQKIHTSIQSWVISYAIGNVRGLSDQKLDGIIASLEDYCVQEKWFTLETLFPRRALKYSGELLAGALLQKAVHSAFFENPFWYLDGKSTRDDDSDEGEFAAKLEYLYDRFYETNPTFATVWKRQTHRLPPNAVFGEYNSQRQEAVVEPLADALLADEQFCQLLIKGLTPEEAAERRAYLVDIFGDGVEAMLILEAHLGGHRTIKRLPELEPIYRSDDKYVGYTYYTTPRDLPHDGRRILLVVRPAIIYSDIEDDYDIPGRTKPNIVQRAHVLLERNVKSEQEAKEARRERGEKEDDEEDEQEKEAEDDNGTTAWEKAKHKKNKERYRRSV